MSVRRQQAPASHVSIAQVRSDPCPDGGPARRLAAARVPFEAPIVPDDTHHWMRHASALRADSAAVCVASSNGAPRAAHERRSRGVSRGRRDA